MVRVFQSVLIVFFVLLLFFDSACLLAQFKVEPRSDLFDFADEQPVEYYSPVRFNRSEGWFPAFGIRVRPKNIKGISLFTDGGYGISNESGGFNAGFEYKTQFWEIFEIGGKYFDDSFTNDEWIIGNIENSFAAFLLREDFHDYFRAKGFTIWLDKGFEDWLHFRLIFWSGDYKTMNKETDWSLFGGNKKFRSNPAVVEDKENKIRLEFIWDRLDNPIFPIQGFYLEGALEKGGDVFGGNFNQTGIFLTGKYFQRSLINQSMVFKIMYGHRNNSSFAPQQLLDMGGIGTLRGYRFKEFQNGHNLLLGSFQYYFNGDLLQKIPLQFLPLYSGLGLIFFAEFGALWENEKTLPPETKLLDSPEWKSDVGFSLSLPGDFIRVDFAKRLDRALDTWAVTFRVLPKW